MASGLLNVQPGAPAQPGQDPAVPPAPGGEKVVPPAAVEPPREEPPKDLRTLYAKLASKDANILQAQQRVRSLEPIAATHQQLMEEMRANPVAALHKHFRLTTTDLNRMALDMGVLPGNEPVDKKPVALTPEMQALQDRLAQLEQSNQQLSQQRQTIAAEQKRTSDVQSIAAHLGARDLPLVNELGKADEVYGHVMEHLKTRGAFESEEEATEVVEFFARQVEERLFNELRTMAQKPSVRTRLQSLLQQQSEATPARQETRALPGVRNPAAPVPNSLANQRTTLTEPGDFRSLPYEEQLRRTAELMRQ